MGSQRELLPQIEVGKPQEYFVYCKAFEPTHCGKRPAERRSRFVQRYLGCAFRPFQKQCFRATASDGENEEKNEEKQRYLPTASFTKSIVHPSRTLW